MKSITSPLKTGDHGPEVVNLQDALSLLIDRGKLTLDAAQRDKLLNDLKVERDRQMYGDAATFPLVRVFQAQYRLAPSGNVDPKTADALNAILKELGALDGSDTSFKVSGHVTRADGTPLAGAPLSAADRDLREEQPLGETTSDANGYYEISYTSNKFSRAEKGTADLIVRVFDTNNKKLAESPIQFNVPAQVVVDLQVPAATAQLSEFEQLTQDAAADIASILPEDLTEDDLNFLAGDTGWDRQKLSWWRDAAKSAVQVTASPAVSTHVLVTDTPAAGPLSPAVFYGWFRQKMPTDLAALWGNTTRQLIDALNAALRSRIIPQEIGKQLDAIANEIDRQRAASSLKSAGAGARPSLGDVLATMPTPLDPNKQVLVAHAAFENPKLDSRFSDSLKKAGLNDEEVGSVLVTLKLGQFTGQNAELIRPLQALRKDATQGTLAFLANLTPADWSQLVYKNISAPAPIEQLDGTSVGLERQIETLHPTEVIAARLQQKLFNPVGYPSDEVQKFLSSQSDFDIVASNVTDFLSSKGIADNAVLKAGLQRLQRVVRVSAGWQEAQVMLERSLDSPIKIVQLGREGFQAAVGSSIDESRSDVIYSASYQAFANTMAIASVYSGYLNPGQIQVIQGLTQASPDTLKRYPELRTLFGDLDTCACDHCASVLSPAAYLVDLLKFVSDAGASGPLVERRPDLYDLLLTCENTDTVLPYIDLVLELLGNAVALPGAQISVAATTIADLDAGRVPDAVRTELAKTVIALGSNLTVTGPGQAVSGIPGKARAWVIQDDSRRWSVWLYPDQLQSVWPKYPDLNAKQSVLTNLQAAVDGLKQRKLTKELQTYLAPGDHIPVTATEVLDLKKVSHVDTGAQRWTVHVSRRVAISILMANPVGTLTWQADDGTVIETIQLPTGVLQLIVGSLNQANLPLYLAQMLPPLFNYTVSWNNPKKLWDVTTEYDVNLTYQPELLQVYSLVYNSSSAQEDLTAAPENLDPQAYRDLDSAFYPWILPFNLFLEEVRVFLEKTGVPRLRLLEQSHPQTRLQDRVTAEEVLCLSKAQADIIFALPPVAGADRVKYWGLAATGNSIPDPDDPTITREGDWTAVLTWASVFLQRAGLLEPPRAGMRDLMNLLQCQFIVAIAPAITLTPADECKPSLLQLSGLSADHLDRMHRFLRLWRTLSWSMHDLDRILEVLGNGASANLTGEDLLIAISHVERLRRTLQIPVATIAGWLGTIETRDWTDYVTEGEAVQDSLYEKLFLNPRIQNLPEPDFSLNSAGTELAYLTPPAGSPAGTVVAPKKITDKIDLVAAALGLRKGDLAKLVDPAVTPVPEVTNDLNLANLSALYRIVSYGMSLGLSVDDYLRLRAILNMNPFASAAATASARTKALLDFAEQVSFVANSGFTLDEVDYLLRHSVPVGSSLNAVGLQQAGILTDLRSTLSALRASIVVQPFDSSLRAQLVRLGWYPDLIDFALGSLGLGHDILSTTPASLKSEMQSFTLPTFDATLRAFASTLNIPVKYSSRLSVVAGTPNVLRFVGWMTADDVNQLGPLSHDGDYGLALASLKQQSDAYHESVAANLFLSAADVQTLLAMPSPDDRYAAALQKLAVKFERDQTLTTLSQAFTVQLPVLSGLAASVLTTGSLDPVAPLLDDKFVLSDATVPVDASWASAQFGALTRVQKAALIVSRVQLKVTELPWLTGANGFDILDLADLPVALVSPAVLYDEWRKFVLLFNLRKGLPEGARTIAALHDVLDANPGDASSFVSVLGDAFEIPAADVTAFAGAGFLALQWPAGYRDPQQIAWLAALLHTEELLGATPAMVQALTAAAPDVGPATTARQLLYSRFGADGSYDAMKAASDKLRNLQRNALMAYLIQQEQLRDSIDLYAKYLIDPEMSPCMLTSRLKQAIGSVQLFIQRCLLNIEDEVTPDQFQDSSRWQWMKNYRVWEANRKVFLYPEDWIEPELRDNKSEIFKKLESELLQADVTSDRAVELLQEYLDGLNDIAKLTVVGMFKDGTTVHVVGRTNNQPYEFYYRQWYINPEDSLLPSYWTPWETIEAKPNSDHVLPFVWRGAVSLAWLNITKLGDDSQSSSSQPGDPTAGSDQPHWHVQIAWAKRTKKGWSAPRVCRTKFTQPILPNKDERQSFALRVSYDPNMDPLLNCYAAFNVDGQPTSQVALADKDETSLATNSIYELDLTIQVLAQTTDPTNHAIYNFPLDAANITYTEKDLLYPYPITLSYKLPLSNGIWGRHGALMLGPDFIAMTVTLTGGYTAPSGTQYPLPQPDFTFTQAIPLNKTVVKSYVLQVPWADLPTALSDKFSMDRAVSIRRIAYWPLKQEDTIVLKPEDMTSATTDDLPLIADTTEHFSSGFHEISTTALTVQSTVVEIDTSRSRFFLSGSESSQTGDGVLDFPIFYCDDYLRGYVTNNSGATSLLIGEDLTVQKISDLSSMDDVVASLDLGQQVEVDLRNPELQQVSNKTLLDITLNQGNAQFSLQLPCADYDWEVFFHIPLLIACALTKNQRFEEAQDWFHLIFNPTINVSSGPSDGYWRFLPFQQAGQGQGIDDLLTQMSQAAANGTDSQTGLEGQIKYWLDHPFQPHAIARFRIRAYQWATVLKYLDNLIAWADQMFRQDTIESINEATQIYLLASEILGRRPAANPSRGSMAVASYREFEGEWDDFANKWESSTDLPNYTGWPLRYQMMRKSTPPGSQPKKPPIDISVLASVGALVFCVPANDNLLSYWDTLDDRLFKIRHCRNIDGIERQLPLFEPPIDPGLLVRATAAGLDIGTILADLSAPMPSYRFAAMLQKSVELCGEVRALGGALLSALEKQDAEHLALLRSTHEIQLLQLVKDIKEKQQTEAEHNLSALRKSRELAAQRYSQYQRLLGKTQIQVPAEQSVATLEVSTVNPASSSQAVGDVSGLALTSAELDHLDGLTLANLFSTLSSDINLAAGIAHIFPDLSVSWPGGGTSFGGSNIGSALNSIGTLFNRLSSDAAYHANRSATIGGHQRRYDEWTFQSNLAAKEMEQIDKQILAAQVRKEIADKDYSNQIKQIENAQEVDTAMREKFSNEDLYQWMVGQVSGLYFQTYQLAYDLAKQAERAYRREIGVADSNFIRFGYWDSLKKGLLCGEKLYLDLKRMDSSYLEQNKREYELTKHVSLLALDPIALIQLKETGTCSVSLPEALFDLDCSGHYLRRLKSVGLTIPCVTGPYTGVNCTLTLLNSRIRTSSNASGNYPQSDDNDRRFIEQAGAIESIVTSSGQNDSGLFETNLRDERYLPFEGAGAISEWQLTLPDPNQFPQFDYDTISDVILHLRYTAREGGDTLKKAASDSLTSNLSKLMLLAQSRSGFYRCFSARREFPGEWNAFFNPKNADTDQVLSLGLTKQRFPFLFQGKTIKIQITSIDLLLDPTAPADFQVLMEPPAQAGDAPQQLKLDNFGAFPHLAAALAQYITVGPNTALTLKIRTADAGDFRSLASGALRDALIICQYSVVGP